jgi:hypothetical protein
MGRDLPVRTRVPITLAEADQRTTGEGISGD